MILLDGNSLTLDDLVAIACDSAPVGLTEPARVRVRAARTVRVDERVDVKNWRTRCQTEK